MRVGRYLDILTLTFWIQSVLGRQPDIAPTNFSSGKSGAGLSSESLVSCRAVNSSRLLVKFATYLVSIGRLLCLAFLYGCLDWLLTLTTQPSTCKLSDNPVSWDGVDVQHYVTPYDNLSRKSTIL